MAEKILRCPICGNKAEVTHLAQSKVFNISCGDGIEGHCGLVLFGGSGVTKKEIIKQWNTRTPLSNMEIRMIEDTLAGRVLIKYCGSNPMCHWDDLENTLVDYINESQRVFHVKPFDIGKDESKETYRDRVEYLFRIAEALDNSHETTQ